MKRAPVTPHEFMQQLGINPRAPHLKQDAQALQANGSCLDAELRLARALRFEHALDRALALELPEDLQAPLLAISEPAYRKTNTAMNQARRGWLTLAAGVSMLALGALGGYYWHEPTNSRNASLVQHCNEHLSHEPFALVRTEIVPKALVQRMLLANGFDANDALGRPVSDALGEVNYLAPCSVNGVAAMHMVVQTAEGPVTVLLMRQQRTDGVSETRIGSVVARVSPLGQHVGAMVLLAESGAALDRVEARFLGALNLSTVDDRA